MKTRWLIFCMLMLSLVVALMSCQNGDVPEVTETEGSMSQTTESDTDMVETTDTAAETESEVETETETEMETGTEIETEIETETETETETEPPMVIGKLSSSTVLRGFSKKQSRLISGTECELTFNEDGSITATGTWGTGDRFAPMISLSYVRLMRMYYPNFEEDGGMEALPNAQGQSKKYPIVAVKANIDASLAADVALDYSLGLNNSAKHGRGSSMVQSTEDGELTYVIFDMRNDPYFTTNNLDSLFIYWTYGQGTAENLGASMTLYEIRLFQTVEEAVSWSGLSFDTEAETENLGGYELTVDDANLNDNMQSMFYGTEVKNETVMFLDYGDSKELMFDIASVISVTSYDGTITYVEGKDYVVQDGKLVLLQGSSIPCITRAKYHSGEYAGFQTMHDGVMKPTFHVGGGPHITCWQVNVTYTHEEGQELYNLPDYSKVYANFIGKLERGEDVTVMFYGDSITFGADSSFIDRYAPDQYSYPLLLVESLAKLYGYTVNFVDSTSRVPESTLVYGDRGVIRYVNTSVGGWEAGGGIDSMPTHMLPHLRNYGCDLLIIAFGMNDGTVGKSPMVFRRDVETIVDKALEIVPDAAVMMVSSMRAHPTSAYDGRQVDYENQLQISASKYRAKGVACAVGCVGSVSWDILERKTFNDYTGNNLNHPNDYFCRVYAQVLLQALLGCYN